MDDIIFYFHQNGIYLVIGIAIIKVLLILLYKGLDIGYLFENFLLLYSDNIGLEPNVRRRRFRKLHNIITVIFYIVLIIWLAIFGVVKFAG